MIASKWFQRSGALLLTLTAILWGLAACAPPPAPIPPTTAPSETEPESADTAVDETPAETGENTKTIFVGSERVECVGVAPQECYLVKENPEDEYTFFYGEIEGFEFEAGYEYELLVEEIEVEDPPADASSLRWVLVAEVSKTPAGETTAEASADTAVATSVQGPLWVLESLNGEPVADGVRVTLQLEDDGSMGGNGGCNQYFGTYTLEGDSLTFGEGIGSTMMACEGPGGEVEAAYLSLLPQVASYQIEGGSLSLLDAEGNVLLVYTAEEPSALTGTSWLVTGYNNGREAVVSPLLDTEITVLFGEEGQLSGNASCNTFSGGYTLDGDAIAVGPLATTRMMCAEEVMQQETEFLTALQNAATFSQDGNLLTLFGADGARMVDMIPAEVTEAAVEMETETDTAVSEPSAEAAPAPDFLLTNWVLGAYRGEPIDDVRATIQFTSDQFSGNGGCNTFFGSYTQDGQNLTIDESIGSTMMACPDPAMQVESLYLATLPQVASYEIDANGLLHLLDADGNVLLTFYEDVPAPLAGTPWTVTFFNNGRGALVGVLEGTEITAVFDDATGTVSGNATCNNFNGEYTVDGDNISVGLLATTMMMCEEERMEQEAEFLSALQSVATYSIEADRMTMFGADGARMLELVGDTNPLEADAAAMPSLALSDVALNSVDLGEQVGGEIVPRLEYDASMPPGPVGHPAHLLFTLDGEPVMRIYPIQQYMAMWDTAGDNTITRMVTRLEEVLADKPLDLENNVPILPPSYGYPDIVAQVRYFDFGNGQGSGVRYLARFAQDANPLTNDQLHYYYQGLSADGQYYVSVIIPIS
ncbi:MAG: META domain-containing protein, partial [Anaerolineales bacterium]|nr:META domain-containing protein [Anaerolineales bacterium]